MIYYICGLFDGDSNLTDFVWIAKFNVHHLYCNHGSLPMQYSK